MNCVIFTNSENPDDKVCLLDSPVSCLIPVWVQIFFKGNLKKIQRTTKKFSVEDSIELSSVELEYIGHIYHGHWTDSTGLHMLNYEIIHDWPSCISESMFQQMASMFLDGKYILNKSVLAIRALEFLLMFKSEFPSISSCDSYIYYQKSHETQLMIKTQKKIVGESIDAIRENVYAETEIPSLDFIDIGNVAIRLIKIINQITISYWPGYHSFLLTAPSGAGKSYLLQHIFERCRTDYYNNCSCVGPSSTPFIRFIKCDYQISLESRSTSSTFLKNASVDMLIELFISLFEDVVSNKSLESGAVEKTRDKWLLDNGSPIILLFDNIDNLLITSSTDTEIFNENSIKLNNGKPFASFLLRRILSDLSNAESTSRRIMIIGTTRLPLKGLFSQSSEIPRFEKILYLTKPSYSDRCQVIESILKSWARQHIQLQMIESSDITDIKEDWSKRLAALTRGYLPGDITRVMMNALKSYHMSDSFINDDPTTTGSVKLMKWKQMLSAVASETPLSLNGLRVKNSSALLEPSVSPNKLFSDSNEDMRFSSSKLRNNLGWSDFGGYLDVKEKLQRLLKRINRSFETIESSAHVSQQMTSESQSQSSSSLNVKRWSDLSQVKGGIVFYGPSGCGKTFLASIVAYECNMTCISIHCTELLSPYFGQTEASIRELFSKARAAAPCLLFFDDFDCLAHSRGDSIEGTEKQMTSRVLSTLLNELDGISSKSFNAMSEEVVLVIVACERLEVLDPALIRSGRLQYHFHLDYPKNQDIEDIIGLQLEEMGSLIDPSISATEICLSLIANENQRKYTCADIVGIGRRAKEMALREFIQKLYDEEKLSDNDTVFRIEMRHFLTF